jgi:hypothetical protein
MGRTRRLVYVYLLGISKVCIWNRVCMVAAVVQHKKWNNSSIYKTRNKEEEEYNRQDGVCTIYQDLSIVLQFQTVVPVYSSATVVSRFTQL